MEIIFPQHELLLMNHRTDPHEAVYYNIQNMKKGVKMLLHQFWLAQWPW